MSALARKSLLCDLALARPTALIASLASVLAMACGSAAGTPDSGAGSGGSPQDSGPVGQGGSGGAAPSGTGGGSGGGDDAASCPVHTAFTLAIHVVVDVTWPETLGANGGSGKVHAWNLARMTASGTSISGMTQPCGSDLPELTLKPLVGGGKFQIDVPNTVWDAPAAPKAASMGTISGWNAGSTLRTEVTSLLAGLTMPDPSGPWPATRGEVMAVDSDSDGKLGFTGVARTGNGYVQPPVTPPIVGSGAKADKIYLVTRTALGLNGTVSSCTDQSGTVTVKFFDNHIVGCHVADGDECTAAHIDFLDVNRSKLTATGGTFTSKLVPDTATCADVRGM